MGLTYNKQFKSKDRMITPSGPRDRQVKHTNQIMGPDQSLINELKSHINSFQEQLQSKSSSSSYTEDDLNAEIEKAIKTETASLKIKHESEINKLVSKIESLEKEVKHKDEMIQYLKELKSNGLVSYENDHHDRSLESNFRPKMQEIYIDPSESTGKMEGHITIADEPATNSDNMLNKVSKLKGLLGKLPDKKY